MDIKRVKPRAQYKKWIISGALFTFMLLVWQLNQPPASAQVKASDLWLGQVKRGDLIAQVEGFGTLQSKYQRLLTAEVQATVEEIILKPGADVKANDVILRLVNPDLTQQLNNQQIEVKRQQANLRQVQLNQKREQLALEAQLASLNAQYKAAKLKLEAESTLAERGIVSQLDIKRAQLDMEQYEQRYDIELRRMAQLKLVHTEAVKVQQELIKQHQGELTTIQRRVDNLTVRASNNGVLQRLPVELGQSVSAGSQLALIGSVNELIALVDISQSQISNVNQGQAVTVKVRSHNLIGEVLRIDPEVTNGTVTVEVALKGDLPASARPEMNIEAHINTGTLTNTLYIERPINAHANTSAQLFVVNNQQQSAKKSSIQLGEQAGKYIQIVAGVNESDQIILSDTSHWQQHQSIMLTQ